MSLDSSFFIDHGDIRAGLQYANVSTWEEVPFANGLNIRDAQTGFGALLRDVSCSVNAPVFPRLALLRLSVRGGEAFDLRTGAPQFRPFFETLLDEDGGVVVRAFDFDDAVGHREASRRFKLSDAGRVAEELHFVLEAAMGSAFGRLGLPGTLKILPLDGKETLFMHGDVGFGRFLGREAMSCVFGVKNNLHVHVGRNGSGCRSRFVGQGEVLVQGYSF